MTLEQLTLRLYSLSLMAALPLISPILLFSPKTRSGLKQKLGFIEKSSVAQLTESAQGIWIHTVSVGEFNGAYPLIEALRSKYPKLPLIISTTTRAGQILANERVGKIAQVIYFPFDLPDIVERFLSLTKPYLIIIFETELWPNFISACWNKKIPVTIVNARMSPRSFKRYKQAKWFFAPIFNKLALIGTQSERESAHYKEIGGNDLPTQVFGNLKYDWVANMDEYARHELRSKLNIASDDLVIIAGSTHDEEEKIVLDTYKRALAQLAINGKNIKLIIAPRHPERFDRVAKMIESAGFRVRRFSANDTFTESDDVYLLDTIGQLANFYSLASVAFVGGTMVKVGGHNLLEPYLYAVPTVCGPYLFKTKETATILSDLKALFIANNSTEVEERIIELLRNEALRKQMGNVGKEWLEHNRGGVAKSLEALSIFLEKAATANEMINRSLNSAETEMIRK